MFMFAHFIQLIQMMNYKNEHFFIATFSAVSYRFNLSGFLMGLVDLLSVNV